MQHKLFLMCVRKNQFEQLRVKSQTILAWWKKILLFTLSHCNGIRYQYHRSLWRGLSCWHSCSLGKCSGCTSLLLVSLAAPQKHKDWKDFHPPRMWNHVWEMFFDPKRKLHRSRKKNPQPLIPHPPWFLNNTIISLLICASYGFVFSGGSSVSEKLLV